MRSPAPPRYKNRTSNLVIPQGYAMKLPSQEKTSRTGTSTSTDKDAPNRWPPLSNKGEEAQVL